MGMMLSKKNMSEGDIKLQYITSAIISKWNQKKITMETQFTDGCINLKGNFVFREKPKRADYILYLNANNPIAIIEAKDNSAIRVNLLYNLNMWCSVSEEILKKHQELVQLGAYDDFDIPQPPPKDPIIANIIMKKLRIQI